MGVLAWADAVDIGGGRGRLARDAAASLARVDIAMRSAFGRAADINEAWRSPEDADKNYAAYLAYLRDPRNNPWAPIAVPGDKSVHCFGYAVDTDDTSDAQMRIWNDHGWYWTVYRNGKLAERWHLEYFDDRDNHRNEGAPASSGTASPIPKEWDEMATEQQVENVVLKAVRQVFDERENNEQWIVSYPSADADRNGVYSAGFGYWHKFTSEEWTHFNGLRSTSGRRIIDGLEIFVPINDRSFDIMRDVCMRDGVAEGEGVSFADVQAFVAASQTKPFEGA